MGAIASKKWRYSLFVNSFIFCANLSLVKGPDAIITYPSGICVISFFIKLMFGFALIFSVTV